MNKRLKPTFNNPAKQIMVALDVDKLTEAETIANQLQGLRVTFKIDNQLGTY